MSSASGSKTYVEIAAQPAALAAAALQLKQQSDWVDRYLKSGRFDEVIFIGSGSSYYQAQTMAATYRKWLGKSALALPSSELYLFRGQHTALNRNYLVVGVSRSGESTEVVLALESVQNLSGYTICGITCYEQSTMARLAECLVSPLGKEESTVMTKSFSSMTWMMQAAIASASAHALQHQADLEAVVAADSDVVQRADAFIQGLVQSEKLNKYIYLGMGAYFGIAQEACLKIKEMSYVWTESYGTLEFRHGPKSVVEPGTLVCVLLSEQARAYELKVAQEMQQYGAYVLIVTAEAGDDTAFANGVFEVGGRQLSDEARAVLYLPGLQYLGYYTALAKGVDPDSPRNLTQVVKI
ncbi:SIS domain-containing protein [Paenibacillus piri]|uniref:SIS domain-containing protein n=1 Tax=Paenibacillus piri TaxID=2547395 RepID=A0A4R5KEN3_9BACL|nr:SIS domain-containing protein [Paenibacillus piri]TDF92600.1 SIS domain-containing protein [Paenibacillus piri]